MKSPGALSVPHVGSAAPRAGGCVWILGLGLTLLAGCGDSATCHSPADCGPGQRCLAGRCQPAGKAACHQDPDCPTGTLCTPSGCVAAPACMADDDCDPGQRCRMHVCGAGPCQGPDCPAQPCSRDASCDPGQRCDRGQCVTAQRCGPQRACPAEQLCVGTSCVRIASADQRYQVPEGGSQLLRLPTGATVTDLGGSAHGQLQLKGGALRFTSTGCEAGAELIDTAIRGANGEARWLRSLVEVVDPGPPQTPNLSLTDQPGRRSVQLTFTVPPENPQGSCPTRRFEVSWRRGDGPEQRQAWTLPDAKLGALITRELPTPNSGIVQLRLRAVDEVGQSSVAAAQAVTTRAEVLRFELSAARAAPNDPVEIRYEVAHASRVQLLRDGQTLRDSTTPQGRWRVHAGIQAQRFQLRVFDPQGHQHMHPQELVLHVDTAAEVEPNDHRTQTSTAGPMSTGRVDTADVDLWRLPALPAGGQLDIEALALEGICPPGLRLRLLDPAGTPLAQADGPCPHLRESNLPGGAHILEVRTASVAQGYALATNATPSSCGNGVIETLAGEHCESGPYCNPDCTAQLQLQSQRRRGVDRQRITGAQSLRLAINMTVDGWVDIGTGDYGPGRCAADSEITLLDAGNRPLTTTDNGGPGACARLLSRLDAGRYYAEVRLRGPTADFWLNTAAHDWGTCGDGVVNPLASEVCDDSSRHLNPDPTVPSPLPVRLDTGCSACSSATDSMGEDMPPLDLSDDQGRAVTYVFPLPLRCEQIRGTPDPANPQQLHATWRLDGRFCAARTIRCNNTDLLPIPAALTGNHIEPQLSVTRCGPHNRAPDGSCQLSGEVSLTFAQ